ncbi:MAG: hypothetical protein ABWU14_12630, partial [Limnospira maxima]
MINWIGIIGWGGFIHQIGVGRVYQNPGCELEFPAEPAPTSVGAGLFTKSWWGGFIHQIGVGRVYQNPGCELEFPAEP